MAVDLPPDPQPSSSQKRSVFVAALAALVDWLYTAIPQFNAAITALNFNSTNGVSSTSVAIGTGSKSITGNTSKSWVKGMTLKIAYDASNWMIGEVSSYDTGTGALVMNIRRVLGSGTYASWTISLAADDAGIEDHVVTVNTGNGYGSTKTKFRRFTTTSENAGTSITYADSATDGASFTINDTGVYAMYYQDTAQDIHGITRNYAAGTASPATVAADDVMAVSQTTGSGVKSISRVAKLTAGDVIRAHSGAVSTDTTDSVQFSIRRLQ